MVGFVCFLTSACALYAQDPARVFEIARWFPTTFQFHNEPLRLITSLANGLGFYGVDAFVSSTNTKQYQRRMRTHEAIVAGEPAKINQRTGRWTIAGVDEDDEAGGEEFTEHSKTQPPPSKSSPIGEMFYGYLMLCANSYQPAMGYLYRAYALQQSDPLLCLLCCVASLGRATNRQVDNRNHTIVQGLAMLQRYAELRGQGPEVDYNFGRAFHHLGTRKFLTAGLHHLALPRYESVLQQAGTTSNNVGFDMVRDAAYNLSLIYLQSGNVSQARALYRTVLAV